MKAKKLLLCILLSLALTVTFIPIVSYGADDEEPNIDDYGSIEISGWEIDEDEDLVWTGPDGAWAEFSEADFAYFEDGYTHAEIGDEVSMDVHAPEGQQVSEVIINDGFYELTDNDNYWFTVEPDTVDEGQRIPGNTIEITFEEQSDDPYEDEDENDFEDYSADWATVADEIALENPATVDTDEKDGLFKFTPEETGVYVFYSYDVLNNEADPKGRVLNADGEEIACVDDSNNAGMHFQIYFKAVATETYYLQAINYSGTATFMVELVPSDIVSISFTPKNPIQLREGVDGWGDYGDTEDNPEAWYWYIPQIKDGDKLSLKKKTENGTVTATYEQKTYVDDYGQTYQVFENVKDSKDLLPGLPEFDLGDEWATLADYSAGDQTEVIVTYAGLEASVSVSFISNPFQSLSISPSTITVKKYCDGDYLCDWSKTSFVFTMNNGAKVKYIMDEGECLTNKETGDEFCPSYSEWGDYHDDALEEDVAWELGKQYVITLYVAGMEQTLQVKVEGAIAHYWKSVSKTPAGLLKNGTDSQICEYCDATQNVNIPGWATNYVKKMKVKKGKKSFTVKWKKQSKKNLKQFNGYEIRYSTAANMSGAKTVKAGKKAKSKKIKGLKKKTTYYVQMRSYTVSGGKTYYSSWTTKKVKTK